jgi:hypothetical protein
MCGVGHIVTVLGKGIRFFVEKQGELSAKEVAFNRRTSKRNQEFRSIRSSCRPSERQQPLVSPIPPYLGELFALRNRIELQGSSPETLIRRIAESNFQSAGYMLDSKLSFEMVNLKAGRCSAIVQTPLGEL